MKCSATFAEPKIDLESYRLFVTQVDPASYRFDLSNGMSCYKIDALCNTEKLPAIGSEITLYPLMNAAEHKRGNRIEGEFEIMDDRDEKFLVWVPQKSEQYFLTVIAIHAICTRPAGRIIPAKYVNIIELSDGSQWRVLRNHTFATGDRILVSRVNEYSLWYLINLDRLFRLAIWNESYYDLLPVWPTKE